MVQGFVDDEERGAEAPDLATLRVSNPPSGPTVIPASAAVMIAVTLDRAGDVQNVRC